MKRQKSFKKIKIPELWKGFKELFIRKFALGLVILIAVFASIFLARSFLFNSAYFDLSVIETKGSFVDQNLIALTNNELLKNYNGRNVFTLNLKAIAKSLYVYYPDARDIRLRIALPDKIVISLKFRKPVAIVNDKKYYPVDEEGLVLPSVAVKDLSELPIILGVNLRYNSQKGASFRVPKNLDLSIELLRLIKKSKILKEYNVSVLDASDPKNILFYLKNGTEIRMGAENFDGRIEALENILKNPRLVIDAIKYIDLRFKDVSIGPKA